MSWNFLRYTQPAIRELIFPQRPRLKFIPDLEFAALTSNSKMTFGRPWKAEELRLKSFDDLHKLWYVLLKEKLALKADELYSKRVGNRFTGRNNVVKVKVSMARLLTVVNERKILLNEFRKLLEDQYIYEAKKLEPPKLPAPERQTPKPMRKRRKSVGEKNMLEEDLSELAKQSVLTEKDIELIKDAGEEVSQKTLLKKYVKNWMKLNGKQRKIALAKIHAARAKQAKEILMKEMYAIGQKRKASQAETKEEDEVKARLANIT
eukprot:TRINITY_DN16389_c0_g1_i2.p2 TRINITY_DN16389_c0_g1~~TRINITY_DN16389_c0_g1_i2.p2  ORF type:complete len:263 (-),score=82.02 TRINITY_DN16389_c0_g1_i2:134-922(-)